MVTLRNKRKFAALNNEYFEEHPRCNLAQNSNIPRSQKEYITQVSEEHEGGVTKNLSQEFSRTRSRILGALSRLDDFHLNQLIRGHSGASQETSGNTLRTNQGTNEDDSHPKASISQKQTKRNSGLDDAYDRTQRLTSWISCQNPGSNVWESCQDLARFWNIIQEILVAVVQNSKTKYSHSSLKQ